MPRRGKEEDKIEMIIRGLLKQPENRRCINCNSLGPQYVCTTFWTFVCTSCSGVHREFTHRVKSVSMAKFNDEEISALQAGGNERAREIYFKTWDPNRNSCPDGSNLHRLREFVKHVYIDRNYAGENNPSRLSAIKLDSRNSSSWGPRDEFLGRLSSERGSNSGKEIELYECSSFEKPSPFKKNNGMTIKDMLEERSPRYFQENARSGSQIRTRSARFEIVDDRFRDDGSVKHYDRYSCKESRAGSRSPGSSRSRGTSLPAIRPVKDLVGEKVLAITIGAPPKANDGKDSETAADASIQGRINDKQKRRETVNSSSLIDFDAQTEPGHSTAEPQAKPTAGNESTESTSSTTQVAANASNMNSVESLLFELSAPVTSPSAQMNSPKATGVDMSKAPEAYNTTTKSDQALRLTQVNRLPLEQKNITLAAEITVSSVETLANPSETEQGNKSPASNDLRPIQIEQSPRAASPGDVSTPTARKELPPDLFMSNFTPFTGWQMHPSHGTGYGVQYHPPAMPVAGFPNPPKPRNPFDIGDDGFQVQTATFPSMSSLQGALPMTHASTALETQPSPYAAAVSSHVSPYGMNMPLVPGAYFGQQHNNMPLIRPQGIVNFGSNEDAFASLNPIQQGNGTDSLPLPPNSSLSRGGNPFG